jgi:hypothetical protein
MCDASCYTSDKQMLNTHVKGCIVSNNENISELVSQMCDVVWVASPEISHTWRDNDSLDNMDIHVVLQC